jgi:cell division septum initiation protein DivIVA
MTTYDTIGPQALISASFPVTLRGYDRESVHTILHSAAATISRLKQENTALRAQLSNAAPEDAAARIVQASIITGNSHVADALEQARGITESALREREDLLARTYAEVRERLEDAEKQAAEIGQMVAVQTTLKPLHDYLITAAEQVKQMQEARADNGPRTQLGPGRWTHQGQSPSGGGGI